MSNKEGSSKLFPVLGIVYLIRYGTYIDSGYMNKFASSEEAIKKIVKTDDQLNDFCEIINIDVDFNSCQINYTYKSLDNEIELGRLYFDKVEVI